MDDLLWNFSAQLAFGFGISGKSASASFALSCPSWFEVHGTSGGPSCGEGTSVPPSRLPLSSATQAGSCFGVGASLAMANSLTLPGKATLQQRHDWWPSQPHLPLPPLPHSHHFSLTLSTLSTRRYASRYAVNEREGEGRPPRSPRRALLALSVEPLKNRKFRGEGIFGKSAILVIFTKYELYIKTQPFLCHKLRLFELSVQHEKSSPLTKWSHILLSALTRLSLHIPSLEPLSRVSRRSRRIKIHEKSSAGVVSFKHLRRLYWKILPFRHLNSS